MRTEVFQVPDRDLQVLVTEYDDERWTIAFRPGYGSWGPPITSMTQQGGGRGEESRPLSANVRGTR